VDLQPLIDQLLAPGFHDREAVARQLATVEDGLDVLVAIVRGVSPIADSTMVASTKHYAAAEEQDGEIVAGAALRALADAVGTFAARGPEIVDLLVQVFLHSNRTFLSRQAASALIRIAPDGALALMARMDDPDHRIRSKVQSWVAKHRQLVVPVLLATLVSGDEISIVRAIRMLAQLQETSAVPSLSRLLYDRSPLVRLAAIDAVWELPFWQPTEALVPLLSDPAPEIRAAAVSAMALDSGMTCEYVLPLLHDSSPDVRLAAVSACNTTSNESVSAAVRARLLDADPRVQLAATLGLAAGGPAVVPILRDLLAHTEAGVRDTAAMMLARFGAAGMDAITAAAASEDPRMRASAAIGLGASGATGPRAIQVLKVLDRLFEDPDESVCLAALAAVPSRASSLVERIAEYLHSPDNRLRSTAGRALTRIGDDEAGEKVASALIRALGDSRREVVRTAAGAIGEAMAKLDPVQVPFPGWFNVTRDYFRLFVSRQARDVIAALERAADGDERTAQVVAGAFASIHRVLEVKRNFGIIEDHMMYLVAPSVAPSKAPDDALLDFLENAAVDRSPREPRYLDATFFQEQTRIPDGAALHEGESYDLEVAIRATPTGIPVAGQRLAVAELPPEMSDTTIIVVAEARAGLTVAQPVARLILPAEGDSTVNASFRIDAKSASTTVEALGEIRLRIFYQLNLLESAVIRAEVVSSFRPTERSHLQLELPIVIEHDQIERGYVGLSDELERSLHIDVGRHDVGYALRFTWKDSKGNVLSLPAPSELTTAEISLIVGDVRHALLAVTMGDSYADKLEASKYDYLAAMRELATIGQRLHTALFRRKINSAMAEVGRLLSQMPPSPGSVVQISVREEASDFLFPWALLYDGELPHDQWRLPDPDGFWGLRYCIEQRLPGLQPQPRSRTRPRPLRMAFMLWDQFRNTSEHCAMVEALANDHRPNFEVSLPPITRESEATKAMQAVVPNDILYFFTHAHIRRRPHAGPDAFTEAFLSLSPDTAAHEAFKQAYERSLAAAGEASWIGLTHGRLKLDELYAGPIMFDNSPLVFLNACESAELTPALSGDSFVNFFLDRGAAAFLGTECTMTVTFAHSFGEVVLREVVAGSTIGSAVLAARRHFIGLRNPLGLAYSLYGNACLSFLPADHSPGT
jgi:HEAT repeat protein